MDNKINVKFGKVQETLLLPLWGRAVESAKPMPRLVDHEAASIIERIDYDFSTIAENISRTTQLAWVARSLHTDGTIRAFIENYPDGIIVNIGCGLDTTFERNDNGRIRFYDLDLPEVMDIRKIFFKDTDRRKSITASFLDPSWLDIFSPDENILMTACGVFYYFKETEIRTFITSLAARFRHCDLFFDIASPRGVEVANRKVIKAGGMDEAACLIWGIEDAGKMEKWDPRIKVVDHYPMFRGFKKGYPLKMQFVMWLSDLLRIMSMVHLKFG